MIGVGEGPSTTMTDFKMAPETSRPKNFTPLPDFKEPTMTEPQKYQEPTATPEMDRLMSDILAQGGVKKPQEIVKQVQSAPVEVKKSQGFWAKVKETIENFFRNLFR